MLRSAVKPVVSSQIRTGREAVLSTVRCMGQWFLARPRHQRQGATAKLADADADRIARKRLQIRPPSRAAVTD